MKFHNSSPECLVVRSHASMFVMKTSFRNNVTVLWFEPPPNSDHKIVSHHKENLTPLSFGEINSLLNCRLQLFFFSLHSDRTAGSDRKWGVKDRWEKSLNWGTRHNTPLLTVVVSDNSEVPRMSMRHTLTSPLDDHIMQSVTKNKFYSMHKNISVLVKICHIMCKKTSEEYILFSFM